jgi:glycosyltransferase involved in cell wall biosynthesis
MMNKHDPGDLVTIGIPVYNSEATIRSVLESLVNQTYSNIEILISDNNSTDSTIDICKEFQFSDKRVTIYEQTENIGALRNFSFLLDQAKGQFFMWNAADDLRSIDFIKVNIDNLIKNPSLIASTSPHLHDNQSINSTQPVTFSLTGTRKNRMRIFFKFAGSSHGIFYALIRTEVIRNCPYLRYSQIFWAQDWVICLYLLVIGPIGRAQDGLTVFGSKGVSSKPDARDLLGIKSKWDTFFPLARFSQEAFKLIPELNMIERCYLIYLLFQLNFRMLVTKNQKFYRILSLLKRSTNWRIKPSRH